MSTLDDAMVAHAGRRGTVWVHGVPATLIAWKPKRSNRDGRHETKARVDFGAYRRTVNISDITVRAVAE